MHSQFFIYIWRFRVKSENTKKNFFQLFSFSLKMPFYKTPSCAWRHSRVDVNKKLFFKFFFGNIEPHRWRLIMFTFSISYSTLERKFWSCPREQKNVKKFHVSSIPAEEEKMFTFYNIEAESQISNYVVRIVEIRRFQRAKRVL